MADAVMTIEAETARGIRELVKLEVQQARLESGIGRMRHSARGANVDFSNWFSTMSRIAGLSVGLGSLAAVLEKIDAYTMNIAGRRRELAESFKNLAGIQNPGDIPKAEAAVGSISRKFDVQRERVAEQLQIAQSMTGSLPAGISMAEEMAKLTKLGLQDKDIIQLMRMSTEAGPGGKQYTPRQIANMMMRGGDRSAMTDADFATALSRAQGPTGIAIATYMSESPVYRNPEQLSTGMGAMKAAFENDSKFTQRLRKEAKRRDLNWYEMDELSRLDLVNELQGGLKEGTLGERLVQLGLNEMESRRAFEVVLPRLHGKKLFEPGIAEFARGLGWTAGQGDSLDLTMEKLTRRASESPGIRASGLAEAAKIAVDNAELSGPGAERATATEQLRMAHALSLQRQGFGWLTQKTDSGAVVPWAPFGMNWPMDLARRYDPEFRGTSLGVGPVGQALAGWSSVYGGLFPGLRSRSGPADSRFMYDMTPEEMLQEQIAKTKAADAGEVYTGVRRTRIRRELRVPEGSMFEFRNRELDSRGGEEVVGDFARGLEANTEAMKELTEALKGNGGAGVGSRGRVLAPNPGGG